MTDTVTPEVLSRQIAGGSAPAIFDVRSRREYEAGHVPGAIHVPFWQIGRRWRTFAQLRDRPVVVYCGHGPRAHIAGAALKRRGFSSVMYLVGHMKKWKALNLPLEVRK